MGRHLKIKYVKTELGGRGAKGGISGVRSDKVVKKSRRFGGVQTGICGVHLKLYREIHIINATRSLPEP